MQGKIVGPIFGTTKGAALEEDKIGDWIKGSFGVTCPIYEKRLAEHGKRFLTGDKLTIADFKAFQHWITASDCNKGSKVGQAGLDAVNAEVAKYPNVQRWVNNMKQELATYLDSGRVPTPL